MSELEPRSPSPRAGASMRVCWQPQSLETQRPAEQDPTMELLKKEMGALGTQRGPLDMSHERLQPSTGEEWGWEGRGSMDV